MLKYLDWISVLLYLALVSIGWVCIYATGYNETSANLLDFSQHASKQLFFVCTSVILILFILAIEPRFYENSAEIFYIIAMLLLAGVLIFGKTINGAKAWYSLGPITIQPAEFAKTATALLFAKHLSYLQTNIRYFKDLLNVLLIILVPCVLIILQPDPGSTLVYGSFIFALNREGMSSSFVFIMLLFLAVFLTTLKFGVGNTITFFTFLTSLYGYWVKKRKGHFPYKNMTLLVILCILTSFSANFIFYNVFKQHHRDRFSLWLRLENEITDSETLRQTVAYNTLQAESAISSGGLSGKGFLEGTLTKGNFVPEQHTDYIFTTLGEEWGLYGTFTVTLLFAFLCLRIWYLAENQKSKFYRIYGYCVASIFFLHFFVNIGMVIGIMPTIGIPLPFFSYGGSGLWGFTMLLFIFLRLNMDKERH
ncbi:MULTISPECIES: rod shape-determining protein RodA [unclassified Capnocytophaga]|jgi:Bacterial cell division membrane protein|uniref:rod shape-determining protein RodA n=1 Tax=unclassified Capnocytophaga TaxID=2640652 RepID=UPI000202DBCB|nr:MULTISPECIES: rod shape-determining protein RodA [unclassified Capnocytophaga]EGD33875.1 rod shape-determining protein RodA [Capnocytophaga sp. oral taxon 338 str. F0234]MEB3004993.1 rod shape-determining protein RodA [Capnocytophaga sp. G2]